MHKQDFVVIFNATLFAVPGQDGREVRNRLAPTHQGPIPVPVPRIPVGPIPGVGLVPDPHTTAEVRGAICGIPNDTSTTTSATRGQRTSGRGGSKFTTTPERGGARNRRRLGRRRRSGPDTATPRRRGTETAAVAMGRRRRSIPTATEVAAVPLRRRRSFVLKS